MNSRRSSAAHSITSSARASSVGGISRPSALGSLEVDDQFELGRLHHRQVGGLFALENATDIDCKLTVGIRHTRPVAHEPAVLHIRAHRVDGGNGWRIAKVAICALRLAKYVSGATMSASFFCGPAWRRRPLSRGRRAPHDLELHTKGSGRRCEIFDEGFGSRGTRVHQRTKRAAPMGSNSRSKLEPLRHHFAHEGVYACGVAAWPIEAGDETEFDRVVTDVKDDGMSRRSRRLQRAPHSYLARRR